MYESIGLLTAGFLYAVDMHIVFQTVFMQLQIIISGAIAERTKFTTHSIFFDEAAHEKVIKTPTTFVMKYNHKQSDN
jgi:hypothetical protein